MSEQTLSTTADGVYLTMWVRVLITTNTDRQAMQSSIAGSRFIHVSKPHFVNTCCVPVQGRLEIYLQKVGRFPLLMKQLVLGFFRA